MSTPKIVQCADCPDFFVCVEHVACIEQPAPASATEPYDENKAYADLYQEWITWSFEFIDTLNPEIPPSDSYQARTIIEDAFDTLRARVAELERVTEASRDSVREEFKQILRDDSSSYPRIVYPSNDVCDEIVRLRAALTAARGGG